jgi:hypothetical protein
MTSRSWIIAGWVLIAVTAGLAIAAIVQVLDVGGSACVQLLVPNGLIRSTCRGIGAEFVHGLICAVLAGVAFFSGLSCFLWAAHLRCMQQMARARQSQAGARHKLFG